MQGHDQHRKKEVDEALQLHVDFVVALAQQLAELEIEVDLQVCCVYYAQWRYKPGQYCEMNSYINNNIRMRAVWTHETAPHVGGNRCRRGHA